VTLQQGKNLKSASMKFSQKERFYKYVVLAQQQGGKGSRGISGTQVRGEYIDQDVQNDGRVLVIQSETAANQKQANARAKWEGVVRAARAATMSVKLSTWRPVPGYIWKPGDLVPVIAPALRVNGQMMISTVGLTASDKDGTPAELTLVRPDAFSPLPQEERTWQE
jgi:prophage tail gpP-like protein